MPRYANCVFSIALISMHAATVAAQEYPVKPMRIVTGAPGGGNDLVSRLLSPGLTARFNHQVIVENRSSSGIIPAEIVSKSAPDGYTLLLAGTDFWLNTLTQKVPYEPLRDFAPIAVAAMAPNVLIVHPSVAASSASELIALAKIKPGVLNYGSSTMGGVSHLAAELFKAMAGVSIIHIPYKGTGPGLTALMGNEIQMMFPNVAASLPHIKSGRIRGLAVTTTKRSVLLPEFPTVTESGLPGYEFATRYGVFAPKGTPAPIIKLLHRAITATLNEPQVKYRLASAGLEVVAGTPEELATAIKTETATMGKLIKANNIRVE
jgi:tripartite-type tricarboxylate transporter receptor subunit TctC